jgi:soluble lytic murein transglycosylase-like protein
MTTKNSGGGLIVVAVLVSFAYLLTPRGGTARYHLERYYRLQATADRSVIETEIRRAADANGLKRSVLRALVQVESGLKPSALSPVGARGLSQVMPFNARRCGLPSADHLWDPVYNLRCGARILREELDQHGDLAKALTVYNCGRVKCSEGQQYAKKVMSIAKGDG